nr:Aldehyde dehydrogenase domain containing protein [Haemonchus contortus]
MVSYNQLVESQRAYFKTGATRSLEARRQTLLTLRKVIEDHKDDIVAAILTDLGRDSTREVASALNEIQGLLDHLEEWNAPRTLPTPQPFDQDNDKVALMAQPLGVVLVIAPWNFPLITSMPVASAIAGGNTVILKPSEHAPSFSSLIARLVGSHFDKNLLAVVEGAVPEATALLQERFDHIMYTGNPTVAKVIMTAAAKNLTPVTLELGGKNPVLVEADADFDDAAKKIIFSKMMNCGQICISSDYILTTEHVKPKLIAAIAKHYEEMAPFKDNKAFARIVTKSHFDRLLSLLKNTKGKIVYKASEEPCREDRFLPPHVIEVEKDDVFMQEEVFGPLLPILTVKSFDEAIEYVRDNEKPLGAYLFTKDSKKIKRFLLETSSGGVTVNDVMSHAFVSTLPFGGVGNSGMGRLNGKYGFDNFVHEKPVLLRNGAGKEVLASL